ncbi:hypothetical protein [Thioclava sp. DLFJ4-1]|uniref:hypothetical protein n=1 Tax=Thioclava sp. DLFJ4-1 TaxID=1915313 RepID=UPI00117F8806|nr:hypothetical protein [Thioclava sp. DLFJ4-1]
MAWRARSASEKTDDWPFWYVTDDKPNDYNKTAEAFELATGERFPPVLPFVSKDGAEAIAHALNGGSDG